MKRENGFTIIEAMIALAAGGIILYLVIMAIPALQRNSRNTQRRNDVHALLAAVSSYELNHSGNFPEPGNDLPHHYRDNVKLSVYDSSAVTIAAVAPPSNVSNTTTVDTVRLYNYQKCDPVSIGDGTGVGAGYNDVVALYSIERGGGTSKQCAQL